MQVARRVSSDLLEEHGDDIVAVGVMGSAAVGEERPFSDVDMIVLAKHDSPHGFKKKVIEGILVSRIWLTLEAAERSLFEADAGLPEIVSGWRSVLALHDPQGILLNLKERATQPSHELFRDSARVCLLETLEDLGKLRNALQARDLEDAMEMRVWFTGGAFMALACLLEFVPVTGRTLHQETRRLSPLGDDIWRLRFGTLGMEEARSLTEHVWNSLLALGERKGVDVRDLS